MSVHPKLFIKLLASYILVDMMIHACCLSGEQMYCSMDCTS